MTFILNSDCFTMWVPWSSCIFVKGPTCCIVHLHIAFPQVFIYKSKNLEHSDLSNLWGINMSVDMTRPKLTSLYYEIEFDFPSANCGMYFNLSGDWGQGVGGGGWQWTGKASDLYFMAGWEIMCSCYNLIFLTGLISVNMLSHKTANKLL